MGTWWSVNVEATVWNTQQVQGGMALVAEALGLPEPVPTFSASVRRYTVLIINSVGGYVRFYVLFYVHLICAFDYVLLICAFFMCF